MSLLIVTNKCIVIWTRVSYSSLKCIVSLGCWATASSVWIGRSVLTAMILLMTDLKNQITD